MSHIVIHDDQTSGTLYAQFSDVQSAAAFLEELHTSDRASNARLFEMEEVHFAVKSYVKVEIGETETIDAPAPETESVTPAETAEQLLEAVPEVFTDAPVYEEAVVPDPFSDVKPESEVDTIEYVEASMAPVDVFAPSESEEPRRGLFGR